MGLNIICSATSADVISHGSTPLAVRRFNNEFSTDPARFHDYAPGSLETFATQRQGQR